MPTTRLLDTVPMPPRIASLPRNKVGYPIPWFVATLADGTRDFRIASQGRHVDALRFLLCWICGHRTGTHIAFTIGPMCAVNRISAEPPAHRDCAVYAAMVCPFLANPAMNRRPVTTPDLVTPAGEALLRNPGVALVWVTRSHRVFRPEQGAPGYLSDIGDPTETLWFAHGRTATRAEVLASIASGLPALRDACHRDPDPAASLHHLDTQIAQAMTLLPADPPAKVQP